MRLSSLLLLLLLLALSLPTRAQSKLKTTNSTAFFFRQRVEVAAYAGKPYRLSARMKLTTPEGDSADANVFAVVLGAKDDYLNMAGNFGRMRARRRDGQWRTFSHQGRLPAGAARLAITGQAYLNGIFGSDDFRLEVETAKGRWQAVPVPNGDFAAARADSASGFPNSWRPLYLAPGFSGRTATEAGNSYLEITGAGLVNYGRNPAAGHTLALNGIKLYYETYGQGEPLLLLHGNGQSIADFNGQIPALFNAAVLDFLGRP